MQRNTRKQKFNHQDWFNFLIIMGIIIILFIVAFVFGRLSAPKTKIIVQSNQQVKKMGKTFFLGNTYSAVYQEILPQNKNSKIIHTITMHFKNDGTMVQKEEQLNLAKTDSSSHNKITVYSGISELNGNILRVKISSLVEATYNSAKKLKSNYPYDVRARGEAFNYPLNKQDPSYFWFSLNENNIYAITSNGQIVKLVKSKQKLSSLPEYAKIFGKKRDQNKQADQENKDNSTMNQNNLIQTQENSDGVYFNFGYFSNGAADQYTIDMQIANPTNKPQYVTLEKIIYHSNSKTYQLNPNYHGQTTIPAFSSKYFPAFFDNLKYDDIFGQFQIYYGESTNLIIKHNNKEEFPVNFSEGQLENSGV